jgi:hypothetical protein
MAGSRPLAGDRGTRRWAALVTRRAGATSSISAARAGDIGTECAPITLSCGPFMIGECT